MAITATTQVVYDGTRNVSVLLTGICDGTDGNETNVVKVDVSELMPAGGRVKIQEIQYDVNYGVVKLSWDAAPAPIDIILLDGMDSFDFRSMGGLPNGADSTATGDILLTTVGFEANSTYSILLKMVKKV